MVLAIPYEPGLDVPITGTFGDWPRDDLQLALDTITGNLDGYQHAEEYDSINIWEQNMLSREGRALRQADIEFDPNFCSVVIDAVNDRLLMTAVTATAGTAVDTAASDAATAAVNQIMESNELDSRYRDWNRKALRDGDAYIMVWPDLDHPADGHPELVNDTDPTDGLAPAGFPTRVNITYCNPRNGRLFYDPQNPRKKLFYAYQWMTTLDGENEPRTRIDLTYPNRIEKWISSRGEGKKTGKDFVPYLDPDDDGDDGDNDYPGSGGDDDDDQAAASGWPVPNPYGVVPVFHLRTAYDYGKPEHRNAFALQDAVSKMAMMMDVVVEFTGFPQRYALQEAGGLGTQSIREDPLAEHSAADWDRDFTESGVSTDVIAPGVISNETGSNYESNPGGMMVLKNFKEVGSFQTATPSAYLEPIKWEVNSIATATSTPLWKFSGLGGQTPSGEALRIAEAPLVQKVLDRQHMFGATWRDVYEFALRIVGVAAQVKISWSNPATSDMAAIWDLVEKKIALGVPRDVALMQAGVSESEAAEWAKAYESAFSDEAMHQAKADALVSQAELYRQQAIAAAIANGIPAHAALVNAGFPADQAQAWMAENGRELGLARRIDLLGKVAEATQALGVAVSLDILTREGANDIVATLLGDLMPEVPSAALAVDAAEAAGPPALAPAMPAAPPSFPPGLG